MERKIGEIFEFGGEWHQCLKSASCDECAFSNSNCIDYPSFKCSVDDRTDNCSVIFKKLEKVGEPFSCDYYGNGKLVMMQEYQLYEANAIYYYSNPPMYINDYNHKRIAIEIKQNKENNMEEKNNNQTEDTPLKRLVSEYINNKIEYSDFEKRVKMLYVDDKGEKLELIPFDLSKAKSGRKLYTRDGKMARIVDFESKGTRPIVALVTEDEEEEPYKYNIDGSYNCSQIQSDYDLFMALEKVEGWININAGIIPYETREEAEKHSKREHRQIKVSWEY